MWSAARKAELAQRAVDGGWDRPRVRAAIQKASLRRATVKKGSLVGRARSIRLSLREAVPSKLSEAERRELRLLFRELAMLAKAPTDQQALVFPALPVVDRARRR